jgi:hypothetical protein
MQALAAEFSGWRRKIPLLLALQELVVEATERQRVPD